METLTKNEAPTFESVWALMKENERKREENERERKENERFLKEQFAETDRRFRAMQKELGSWANNHGSFAEEYFFNSFENGKKNFFGEKFDRIEKNVKGVIKDLVDEYDIVMYDGNSVAIIEVKFKAHTDHIPKLLKKAETFKTLFPYYKDYKIYLGLASLSFHVGVEQECVDQGIAVIKQVGESVLINDTHLKVF